MNTQNIPDTTVQWAGWTPITNDNVTWTESWAAPIETIAGGSALLALVIVLIVVTIVHNAKRAAHHPPLPPQCLCCCCCCCWRWLKCGCSNDKDPPGADQGGAEEPLLTGPPQEQQSSMFSRINIEV
jgi:hypothetical protein